MLSAYGLWQKQIILYQDGVLIILITMMNRTKYSTVVKLTPAAHSTRKPQSAQSGRHSSVVNLNLHKQSLSYIQIAALPILRSSSKLFHPTTRRISNNIINVIETSKHIYLQRNKAKTKNKGFAILQGRLSTKSLKAKKEVQENNKYLFKNAKLNPFGSVYVQSQFLD